MKQNNQSGIESLYGSIMKVVDKTMQSFDEVEEKHNGKQSINWDYEMGRDRKAAIIIKGALAAVHVKQAINRENQISLDSKKLERV
jgi:hypothetical protein